MFTPWRFAAAVIDNLTLELVKKCLLLFTLAMNQLCSAFDCSLYQPQPSIESVEMSAALLGSGIGGRVYKVIGTDADGKESIKEGKIVGLNPDDELSKKTKKEFNDIRRIKTVCPNHVLGVCGEAITEGVVEISKNVLRMIKANHMHEDCLTFEVSYLGYLMPTVVEPIKGAISEGEVFLILHSLFTLHCHGEFHGSARVDNIMYNAECGLYQWIDFRYSTSSLCTAIACDMYCFFYSLRKCHYMALSLPHAFEQKEFYNYAQHIVIKNFQAAWLVLEDKMSKVRFSKK